jgi:hypothetical protein
MSDKVHELNSARAERLAYQELYKCLFGGLPGPIPLAIERIGRANETRSCHCLNYIHDNNILMINTIAPPMTAAIIPFLSALLDSDFRLDSAFISYSVREFFFLMTS